MSRQEFYLNAALYAMQGMQESGGKLGVLAELVPGEVAEHAFKFADAMLKEAEKREIIFN